MGGVGSGGSRNRGSGDKAIALKRWPPAPEHLDETEQVAWGRLGIHCMAARTITKSDLLSVELTARVLARVDRLFADEELKVSQLTAYLGLLDKQLRALGLCPAARRAVVPLAPARDKKADPMAAFED